MNNKLQVKDLITVGIFTAIYFVVFFTVGMVGLIPILMIFLPAIVPIIAGIPFMLFLTKTHKFGMVTIMSSLVGLLMLTTGHTWIVLITALSCGIVADLILKAGKYKSSNLSVIAFGIFSMWSLGAMSPFWFARETYFNQLAQGYGTEYSDALASLTPPWLFPIIIIATFLGGILGGLIGKAIMKKHFKKAGIV